MNMSLRVVAVAALLGLGGCSKLFVSYCDRVAQGTADQNWIADPITYTIPFSKTSYRNPEGTTPGAVCITMQGETPEKAAGKNFLVEIADANDSVIAKRAPKASAQPINTENQLKLWGGTHASNTNKFESTECFNISRLDPFVKVKVKKLSSGETDETKLWNNQAFCKDRQRAS